MKCVICNRRKAEYEKLCCDCNLISSKIRKAEWLGFNKAMNALKAKRLESYYGEVWSKWLEIRRDDILR